MTRTPEAIAVIGAACRFPGAGDLRAFWDLLRHEQDALTRLSEDQLLAAGVAAAEIADADYVRAAMLTPGMDEFDADFFGLSAAEADACDPAARSLLTVAHSAVEDAGYDVASIRDDVAVFAAGQPSRYRELHRVPDGVDLAEYDVAAFVSARLDLRGPSISLGTCSLLAVQLAAQSLLAGDCDVALAGGTHLQLPYSHGYRWTPGCSRPPDGLSRPYDAAAAGCVAGSGSGVLVLRRLGDAIADGDDVRAVVRGGACGHRGADESGSAAVAEALAFAGVGSRELSYVEASGTALPAADAAEVAALAAGLDVAEPLPMGSVSSNVGQLGAAAGIAGLIKTVLSLQREYLPAVINVTRPHPAMNLETAGLRVATTSSAWPRVAGDPRRCLVHSTSPGGASTALVVEEGLPATLTSGTKRPRIVVWSAREPETADTVAGDLAGHFARVGEGMFPDVTATLQQGRTPYPVRRAVVCDSSADAAAAVTSTEVIAADRPVASSPAVVFDFPGLLRGQRIPVGLYGAQPAFTEAADECLDEFEQQGVEIYQPWLAGRAVGDAAEALCFTAEYATAAVWRALGIRPAATVGVDVGAVAAAVAAEEIGLDEAVRMVLARRWPQRPVPDVDGSRILLTVGPARSVHADTAIDSLDSGEDDERQLLSAIARLWVHGVGLRWDRLEPSRPLQRRPVPGYPLRPRRHWLVPDTGPAAPQAADTQASEVPPDAHAGMAVADLPAPAEPLRPLGRTEHAFWVLDQLAPDSGVSNIGIAFRTAQPLRWWPLRTAANQLIRRHPALRARFPEVAGVPVRHVTAADDAELTVQTSTTTQEKLLDDLQRFLHEPFDLGHELLFRLGHFTLPDRQSVVCLAAHHIVIDAPSVQILLEELGQIYDSVASTGRVPVELTDEAPLLAEPEPAPESVRFWLDHLRGARPEAMALPGSRPAPVRPTFAGHTCSWPMAERTQQAMRQLRRELRTTDNLILMSAFCLTLLRHGASADMVIGVPVGTRRPATEKQVGYGVSTLPLRIRIDPAAGFADLVRRVADAFLTGVEHADVTVERVVTERGHGTGDWRVPLFRHMFNYRPWSDDEIRICGAIPDYIEDLFDRSRLDLQCIAVPERDRLTLRCWHSTEVQDEDDVEAFVARMQALLERACAEPDRPLADLPFASAADEKTAAQAHRKQRRWDGPPTVPECIAARAEVSSEAPALVDDGGIVTYRDLIAHAAAVRVQLRRHGVQRGDVVAVAMNRSPHAAAAVLGVWAAGAVYLPLDPGQPSARLGYQVTDAKAVLVLTADGERPAWATVTAEPAAAREFGVPGSLFDDAAPMPDDPAYVMYTSGSTGRPKGVAVSHRNLRNLLADFGARLPDEAAGAVLWSTTTTFDISLLELLLPLVNGGSVVVAAQDALLHPRDLLKLVRERDLRLVQATPTAWRLILPEAAGELAGRTLLCGGEPMSAALARELRAQGGRVLNVYGPTETTIWSSVTDIAGDEADPVPIGVPLANTVLFVLDQNGNELPPGIPGELCIAGDGVSLGYLHRPELTAQRYGDHPRHGRFYRTGDIARQRHDGTFELHGRDDRQVKLRGHRIELGEVENVLLEHPEVGLAAAVVEGDRQQDGQLSAYVQPSAAADVRGLSERLWEWARERLPSHSVPSGITMLEQLPTTPNGKVDYPALRIRGVRREHAAVAEAGGDSEVTAAVTAVWREVLNRPELGERDNFFLNGGHSILAARLVSRIAEATGQAVPVRAVFDHPTPAGLAAYLASRADAR